MVLYYLVFDIFTIIYHLFIAFNVIGLDMDSLSLLSLIKIFGVFFMIYLSICIWSLHKKLKNEAEQGILHVNLLSDFNYPCVENVPQMFPTYQQNEEHQQPPTYLQCQAHSPQTPQNTIKFVDASGLPTYDSIISAMSFTNCVEN